MVNDNMQVTAVTKKADATWPILAGIRFLLCFIVLITHCHGHFRTPNWLANIDVFSAWAAVAGFFIISGYSIAHSVYHRPDGFYRRRIERIYPVYFACLVIAIIPYFIWGHTVHMRTTAYSYPSNWWEWIGSLFFLGGLLVPKFQMLGVAWSLNLEVFFYALAPWFKRLNTRWLLAFILLSGGCYFKHWWFFRWDYGYSYAHIGNLEHGQGIILSAWLWLLGFLYYRHREETWVKVMLLLMGVFLLEWWDFSGTTFHVFPYVVAACGMVFPLKIPTQWFKPLSYLGDISFPLYLVQAPVLILLTGGMADRPWWLFILCSLIAALGVLHGIDYPTRNLARRLETIKAK